MSLLSRLLQKAEAKAASLRALESNGTQDVGAIMDEANEHFRAGRMDAARLAFQRVLEVDRRNAQALYMLGAVAVNDKDTHSAVGLVQMAIGIVPDRADYHVTLGSLYCALGRLPEAIRSYQEALRLKPNVIDWYAALANALTQAGRLNEAAEVRRARLGIGTPDAGAYFDLGNALQRCGGLQEAEQAFHQATLLAPGSGEAQVNLAMARRDQSRPVDAEPAARKAVELAPGMPEAWFVLGSVLGKQARHVEAVECYRRAIALKPDYDAAWSGLLFAMSYSEHWAPREVYEAHLQWGKRFPAVPPAAAGPVHHESGRRIRVGYLSPDYWRHPVAHFMEPVLRYHDRARFEIFCYHTGVREDEVTARLKTLPEHWRALPGIADDELEARLRGDKIEILVELSGHTDGTRLPVLARRIAPVQVSYLGYPNTTGLAAMDYRITDACADPAGESDQLHTEKLIRLPGTFLCYAPPIVEASNRIPPSRRKRYVTFGSFNNFAKISPTSIRLWASILASVPGSKLFIKTHGLQDPGLRALLQERLQGAGVPADRLLLAPPTTDHRRHLETYDEVDVALDTFPYHGTTTTLDALWMGVPVVTLIGDRHASRVGLSILSGLGLNELIAHTHDEYVACAVRLAFQPEQLEEYAHDLRARLAGSALTDGKRFTAHLEEAFLQLWQAPARPT